MANSTRPVSQILQLTHVSCAGSARPVGTDMMQQNGGSASRSQGQHIQRTNDPQSLLASPSTCAVPSGFHRALHIIKSYNFRVQFSCKISTTFFCEFFSDRYDWIFASISLLRGSRENTGPRSEMHCFGWIFRSCDSVVSDWWMVRTAEGKS